MNKAAQDPQYLNVLAGLAEEFKNVPGRHQTKLLAGESLLKKIQTDWGGVPMSESQRTQAFDVAMIGLITSITDAQDLGMKLHLVLEMQMDAEYDTFGVLPDYLSEILDFVAKMQDLIIRFLEAAEEKGYEMPPPHIKDPLMDRSKLDTLKAAVEESVNKAKEMAA